MRPMRNLPSQSCQAVGPGKIQQPGFQSGVKASLEQPGLRQVVVDRLEQPGKGAVAPLAPLEEIEGGRRHPGERAGCGPAGV